MIIILLGPPGVGKGTHAGFIAQRYGIPHISTGVILRDAIAAKTPLGLEVAEVVNSGGLVPDDLILEVMRHRLVEPDCRPGALLDGFPRTIPQADGLRDLLKSLGREVTYVLHLQAPDRTIITRLSVRQVCPNCDATYNKLYSTPKQVGLCDVCGTRLVQREDDTEAAIAKRLRVYRESTAPLIDYYQSHPGYNEIDATGAIGHIRKELSEILHKEGRKELQAQIDAWTAQIRQQVREASKGTK